MKGHTRDAVRGRRRELMGSRRPVARTLPSNAPPGGGGTNLWQPKRLWGRPQNGLPPFPWINHFKKPSWRLMVGGVQEPEKQSFWLPPYPRLAAGGDPLPPPKRSGVPSAPGKVTGRCHRASTLCGNGRKCVTKIIKKNQQHNGFPGVQPFCPPPPSSVQPFL